MRTLLLSLALWCANALAVDAFVSPSGNDSNNCLSAATACLTLQRGADVAVGGDAAYTTATGPIGTLTVANGTYSAGINLVYFKVLTVTGNCADHSQVTISANNAVMFQSQDGAILTVKCMTLTGTGSVGFASRQNAIIDHDKIRFTGVMAVYFAANEQSKINCLTSVTIAGNATYAFSAGGQSAQSLNCAINLTGGVPAFSAFLYAVQQGLINMPSATISGSATGMPYINDSSLIVRGGVTVPGNGTPVCQNGCIME